MTKKILFTSLILFGFVLFGMAKVFFADASAELEQAKLNILSLIKEGNYAEAEVQTQKLIADFSEHKDIAKAVWQIAKGYEEPKKYDKAFQLHQYNVEHFPSDMYAMWSQVEIVYSHIRDANDTAADVAFNKLLAAFSQQPTLPKEVYQIAMRYNKSRKPDKALTLHQYNAEHFSKDDVYLMWSQVEVIYSNIRGGDDAAADAAFNKLLTVFSNQPTLPKEIYQVAMEFNKAGKEEKAFQLHQYNVEHFPSDMYTMWSQVEIIKSHIHDANDAATDAAVNKLLAAFSQQPALPKEIYLLAMKFKKVGKEDRAFQLHQYNADYSSKDDMYTMWSQVEIVKFHIRDGNDAAADAACDKLLAAFSQQPTLPLEIYQLADKYDRDDKASQLYQYAITIDRSSTEEAAIWAQAALIRSYHALGDDAAAEAAVDKLLANFSDNPLMARVVWELGQYYYGLKKYDKASRLYQYVLDNWSKTEHAMRAKADMAKLNILLGNEAEVEAALDSLIADFNDHPGLAEAIFTIGEEYYYNALDDANEGLTEQAEANFKKTVSVWDRIITGLLHPNSAVIQDAYYFAGYCYGQLGEYEKAIQYWQKIVDDWPDYKYAWDAQFRIAYSYYMLGNSGVMTESEAQSAREQAYKAVVENYPDCPRAEDASVWLGDLNYARGQWADAARYLEFFLEKSDDNRAMCSVVLSLSQAYEKMGEPNRAAEAYRIFIEIADPADARIKGVKAGLEKLEGATK